MAKIGQDQLLGSQIVQTDCPRIPRRRCWKNAPPSTEEQVGVPEQKRGCEHRNDSALVGAFRTWRPSTEIFNVTQRPWRQIREFLNRLDHLHRSATSSAMTSTHAIGLGLIGCCRSWVSETNTLDGY